MCGGRKARAVKGPCCSANDIWEHSETSESNLWKDRNEEHIPSVCVHTFSDVMRHCHHLELKANLVYATSCNM
jgi:hypothetical protein